MKTKILFTLLLGTSFTSTAQIVEDSIQMMPGYTNESYYSLANDEQLNIDNTTWDLAFDLSGFGASIRTNEHTGTKVFVYPNGTDWASLDTTGMAWNVLHNSETKWSVGSFDQTIDPSNPFDLGWGVYNTTTHQVTGDSIHIVQLASGDYKKVMIESLAGGTYTFKHADLDGSNEVSNGITKSDYTEKNFVYYSITNDQILDREPTNTTWDIVFTKYVATLSPGVTYGVTGVLSNNGVHVREASGIDPAAALFSDYAVDSVINVVGWDWKSFNGATFSYDIASDLSYFIEDQAGDIWQVIFTRFDGSSTGKVVFSKELVSSASLADLSNLTSFGVYPNPAQDNAHIVFNSSADKVDISIIDIQGKLLFQETINEQGFVTHPISLKGFDAGSYFIQAKTSQGSKTLKILVQ